MVSSLSSTPQSASATEPVAPARVRWLMIGGVAMLGALAGLAWLTRADALFLELASAALAMCF